MELHEANIVSREEWGAKDATHPIESLQLPATEVILTYTGTNPCTTPMECKEMMQHVQAEYLKNNFPDAGQNFYVGGDGNIYEGRGWHIQPEPNLNCPQLHGKAIEICHFGKEGERPPQKYLQKCWQLIELAVRKGYLTNDHGYYSFFQYYPDDKKYSERVETGDYPPDVNVFAAWYLIQSGIDKNYIIPRANFTAYFKDGPDSDASDSDKI